MWPYIRTRSSIDEPKQLRRYDPVTVIYRAVKLLITQSLHIQYKLLIHLMWLHLLSNCMPTISHQKCLSIIDH